MVAELPYDVMDADEGRAIVEGNPWSFLRVDKAEIEFDRDTDPFDDRVYERAQTNLHRMMDQGLYLQEAAPCYYVYRLTIGSREQYGLVCLTSVDEYLNKTIKKHELTISTKERDRTRHIEALNAHTGPIFMACADDGKVSEALSSWAREHTPIYDFAAANGVQHTVWIVDCDEARAALRETFGQLPALYIADGHHRTAAAVNVALARREASAEVCGSHSDHFLAVVFPAQQLEILSYNRAVKRIGMDKADYFAKVQERFDIEPTAASFAPEEKHSFGMYIDGAWHKLTAKGHILQAGDPIASLDASILQNELLSPVLGIEDPRTSSNIDFVGGARGLTALEQLVDIGSHEVAFSMHPTSIGELIKVADADLIMPPKSTWFEPKLLSGLFIHLLYDLSGA